MRLLRLAFNKSAKVAEKKFWHSLLFYVLLNSEWMKYELKYKGTRAQRDKKTKDKI